MRDMEGSPDENRDDSRQESRQESSGDRPVGGEGSNPFVFSIVVGFFAGLFWGFTRWLTAGFGFTTVPQAFLADPFVRRTVLAGAGWQWFGLLLFIVMSIIAALVYWVVLGRLSGPWPGILFGAAWWAMLFLAFGPQVGLVEPLRKLGWQTIITEFCLYLVWGLFIGYSIAFEYHDEAAREPAGTAGRRGREPRAAS